VQRQARAIQDRSAKRLKKSRDGTAITTSLALMQFEARGLEPPRRTRKKQ
jgi:hypothetical protein